MPKRQASPVPDKREIAERRKSNQDGAELKKCQDKLDRREKELDRCKEELKRCNKKLQSRQKQATLVAAMIYLQRQGEDTVINRLMKRLWDESGRLTHQERLQQKEDTVLEFLMQGAPEIQTEIQIAYLEARLRNAEQNARKKIVSELQGLHQHLNSALQTLCCPICLETPNDRSVLACRHSFCVPCFEKLTYSPKPNCPICRAPYQPGSATRLSCLIFGQIMADLTEGMDKISSLISSPHPPTA